MAYPISQPIGSPNRASDHFSAGYTDVTGSRVSGTEYTAGAYAIAVMVTLSGACTLIVDGITFNQNSSGTETLGFIVPPGAAYKLTGTFSVWAEAVL